MFNLKIEEKFAVIVMDAFIIGMVIAIIAGILNSVGLLKFGLSISLALVFFALTYQREEVVKKMPIFIGVLAYILYLTYSKDPVFLEMGIAIMGFYIIAKEYCKKL